MRHVSPRARLKARIALGLALIVSTSFTACGKDPSFVFFEPQKDSTITATVPISEVRAASAVDILWVIDNSGSMASVQQNVIANTSLFMQAFTRYGLDWKMGLLSTSESELPYIGFTPGDEALASSPNSVLRFQTAVGRLGINGDATEKTLRPIVKNLRAYPNFLRPNTPLAIIMVSDEDEQSEYQFSDFLREFKQLTGDRRYLVYGVLKAPELNCGGYAYRGSPYEAFIQSASLGRAYPICASDFGTQLAQIGTEIAEQVQNSVIYLKHRPKPSTIVVRHKGVPLAPRDAPNGGYWVYDFELNAIVFDSLDFSTDLTDQVELNYEIDDGLPPSGTMASMDGMKATRSIASELTSGEIVREKTMEIPFILETAHPYEANLNTLIPIQFEGAKKMQIFFEKIETESSYDQIRVYNTLDQQIHLYEGTARQNFWTNEIDGDRAAIHFRSDSSNQKYGYRVTKLRITYDAY